ncbi:MAG TPA: PEP/pyruvate-binding domain-containing protein [Candidatus Limnocylindrales bacterium]|nr:PEP/pyruvate-binding domain-containing protein [Candidatus Limnocylindrales bacterium]
MHMILKAEARAGARIVPLAQAREVPEVGGKAARLGELMARGERVPDGFCVIGSGAPAVTLALDAYRRMGSNTLVAVRSSASAEDGSDASFAGQFDTVLNVRGEEELSAALATCWDSLSGDRVAAYLRRRDMLDLGGRLTMSVLVQRMVDARVAGVAFSADPLLGTRDVVVIHAVKGLGDRLVSGEVTPDRFRVLPDDDVQAEPAIRADDGLREDQARQIAGMVRRIAEAEGSPQDIEWAIDDGGGPWLLQARPMTALPPEASWGSPIPGAKWIKDVQTGEWATEPPSPLGATTTFEAMATARQRYRGWPPIPKAFEPSHILINGWLYMRLGGPSWTFVANVVGAIATLLTVGLNGHRRVRKRWGPRLTELDELSRATPADMDVAALGQHAHRLLDALGWWWVEVGFFASLVRVGQMLVVQARPRDLEDAGLLFRGNDSLLLDAERAMRKAAQDPNELGDYLARFGHLVESADPIHPTLAESPETQRWLLAAARADRDGPDVRLARTRVARSAAEPSVTAIRGPRGFLVRRALIAGQSHAAHTDDAVFHLQRILALLRATFLEQGRRLAGAGVIDRPEDVFYLEAAELWAADENRRELIAARRAIRDARKKLTPPPIIPPAGDPTWANDPVLKMLPSQMRAQLIERGLQVRDGQRVVVGTPSSPGTARGIARVLTGPGDFGRFQPGDVLVAHATSPIWTPLLAIAAAAVTEVGGPFAHAAIVAREFGIPLVDGALDATTAIPDGTPVMVDGSSGIVAF